MPLTARKCVVLFNLFSILPNARRLVRYVRAVVPFRMGVLRWSALDIGRFGLVVTPIGSISSQLFVVPWIKKVGNQRAFQTGCIAGALGWTLCGQCWRIFGVATRGAATLLRASTFS